MSKILKIAFSQTKSSFHVAENLDVAARFTALAAAEHADLVVFPEMFMARPQEGVPLAEIAQPLDGNFVTTMASLAKQHALAIAFGMWQKHPDDELRAANVVIVIDAEGSIIARYQKIHLFDALSVQESKTMIAGEEPPPVFILNGVRIGLAICYDLRFPELFRYLADNGAQLTIVPAAWYAGNLKEEHWLTLLRARAIENTFYVGGCNLCDPPFAARSALFDPFGAMLVEAGESEKLIFAEVNTQRIDEVRAKLPSLSHCKQHIFNSRS
ncbi:MAG: carbon-nitrogen hydrolase family protein [Desulfuromonadales bacterium]|nr:carbon-nitrogen hydrolase family protein [Desulfuromonadales bacterium]MBN2793543.1 carbon-nitrogen hydrolase family protein [Desulfuromonadales bacterium]